VNRQGGNNRLFSFSSNLWQILKCSKNMQPMMVQEGLMEAMVTMESMLKGEIIMSLYEITLGPLVE
jgi:hypothetical protein